MANESTAVNRLSDLAASRPLRDSMRYLGFDAVDPIDTLTTMPVRRLPHPLWQYAIPATISVMCGVLIGVLVTRGGGSPSHASAATPTPAPAVVAPAPPPKPARAPIVVIAPIETPAPPSSQVQITFETTPPGATVTLVDNGKPSYIGTTPVEAAVDVTHRYDVVYTRDGYITRVMALDPSITRHAEAQLDLVKVVPDKRVIASHRRRR
jgi:hypothetical protein